MGVRDIIAMVRNKKEALSKADANRIWRTMDDDFKESLREFMSEYKFPGQGETLQPVITLDGAMRLIAEIPSKTGKAVKDLIFGTMTRYLAGDLTLLPEVIANAASTDPVAGMARESVAAEGGSGAVGMSPEQLVAAGADWRLVVESVPAITGMFEAAKDAAKVQVKGEQDKADIHVNEAKEVADIHLNEAKEMADVLLDEARRVADVRVDESKRVAEAVASVHVDEAKRMEGVQHLAALNHLDVLGQAAARGLLDAFVRTIGPSKRYADASAEEPHPPKTARTTSGEPGPAPPAMDESVPVAPVAEPEPVPAAPVAEPEPVPAAPVAEPVAAVPEESEPMELVSEEDEPMESDSDEAEPVASAKTARRRRRTKAEMEAAREAAAATKAEMEAAREAAAATKRAKKNTRPEQTYEDKLAKEVEKVLRKERAKQTRNEIRREATKRVKAAMETGRPPTLKDLVVRHAEAMALPVSYRDDLIEYAKRILYSNRDKFTPVAKFSHNDPIRYAEVDHPLVLEAIQNAYEYVMNPRGRRMEVPGVGRVFQGYIDITPGVSIIPKGVIMRPGADPAPGPLKSSDFIFPCSKEKLSPEMKDANGPKYVRMYGDTFYYSEPIPPMGPLFEEHGNPAKSKGFKELAGEGVPQWASTPTELRDYVERCVGNGLETRAEYQLAMKLGDKSYKGEFADPSGVVKRAYFALDFPLVIQTIQREYARRMTPGGCRYKLDNGHIFYTGFIKSDGNIIPKGWILRPYHMPLPGITREEDWIIPHYYENGDLPIEAKTAVRDDVLGEKFVPKYSRGGYDYLEALPAERVAAKVGGAA